MTDSTLPVPRTAGDSPATTPTSPLVLRLEDLPAYGSSDVEPPPLKTRLLIGGAIVLALALGLFLGLRPYWLRQHLMSQMDRQITAGQFTAAQTTFDRFAALFPEHPELRRYGGLLALSQAHWTEAEEKLTAHAARFPEDQRANLALGYLYGLEVIYQQAPASDQALRSALITDWTRLFHLSVTGVDPGADSLNLAETNPAAEAVKVLRRARDNPDQNTDRTLPQAALWGLEILLAPSAEAGAPFVAELSAVKDVNMPSFIAFQSLRPAPEAQLPIPQIQTPPAPNIPGMEGIPNLPTPGAIEELPSDGTAPPAAPTPGFQLPMRGAGDLGALLDESGADAAVGSPGNDVPGVLNYPSGMGVGPTVRPAETGSYKRMRADGTEEVVQYVTLINIRAAGNTKGRAGETVELPNTGTEVTIESISPDGDRVVLREKNRGVYVFIHFPGSKWQWDPTAPENDGGQLRKDAHKPVAEQRAME